ESADLRSTAVCSRFGWRCFRSDFVAFDQDRCSAVFAVELGPVADVHFRKGDRLSAIRTGEAFWRLRGIIGHRHNDDRSVVACATGSARSNGRGKYIDPSTARSSRALDSLFAQDDSDLDRDQPSPDALAHGFGTAGGAHLAQNRADVEFGSVLGDV